MKTTKLKISKTPKWRILLAAGMVGVIGLAALVASKAESDTPSAPRQIVASTSSGVITDSQGYKVSVISVTKKARDINHTSYKITAKVENISSTTLQLSSVLQFSLSDTNAVAYTVVPDEAGLLPKDGPLEKGESRELEMDFDLPTSSQIDQLSFKSSVDSPSLVLTKF